MVKKTKTKTGAQSVDFGQQSFQKNVRIPVLGTCQEEIKGGSI